MGLFPNLPSVISLILSAFENFASAMAAFELVGPQSPAPVDDVIGLVTLLEVVVSTAFIVLVVTFELVAVATLVLLDVLADELATPARHCES
jgi:hypothetical protein